MGRLARIRWLALPAVLAACAGTPAARSSPGLPSPTPSPTASVPASPAPASPAPRLTPAPAKPSPSPSPGYSLPPNLVGVEWEALPTSRKVVALTFDGGSGSQGLAAILAALGQQHVAGTFFLTGSWVAANPAGARLIAADPSSSIGNHSWDHPYCTGLTDAQLRSEVAKAEAEIESVTGRDPRPLFRFPYGDRDARTIADVNALGYGSIRWTVDTLGWEGKTSGQSAATVLQRVKAAERPGEIVLMHIGAAPDGSTLDADALPSVIAQLKADGYGFVAIWDFINGLG